MIDLIKPELQYQEAYRCYCAAFRSANEPPRPYEELAILDFPAFIQKLKDQSQGAGLPEGYVPSTHYWLVADHTHILGNSQLRHTLTPALERYGGHIGYAIHPNERGKGYGTLILALTLEKARSLGLRRVLVTCDADNLASARVITHNGGVLEDQRPSAPTGKLVSRYWISLMDS